LTLVINEEINQEFGFFKILNNSNMNTNQFKEIFVVKDFEFENDMRYLFESTIRKI
jgi:hypothetical protein